MKQKKGQAGLNLFLTIIAMIFVIGIIIMSFALTSSQLLSSDSSFTRTDTTTVNTEGNYMNGTLDVFNLDKASLNGVLCSVSLINNGTDNISSGNYTISNCQITQTTVEYENQTWYTNYTYTYLARNEVSEVINESNIAISGAVDWFSIFITIAAVVTLILLIVLIIVSLRGAGLMGGGDARP